MVMAQGAKWMLLEQSRHNCITSIAQFNQATVINICVWPFQTQHKLNRCWPFDTPSHDGPVFACRTDQSVVQICFSFFFFDQSNVIWCRFAGPRIIIIIESKHFAPHASHLLITGGGRWGTLTARQPELGVFNDQWSSLCADLKADRAFERVYSNIVVIIFIRFIAGRVGCIFFFRSW